MKQLERFRRALFAGRGFEVPLRRGDGCAGQRPPRARGQYVGRAHCPEVANEVAHEFPNVSVPTVYSALEVLADLGFARRVTVAPGAVLYDPHTDDHHHLVCSSCRRVIDIDLDLDTAAALASAERHGFAPERAELVVTGLCSACRPPA